jgi:hypothetical protein
MDSLPAHVRLTSIEDRVDEAITERRTKMGKIVISEDVSLDGVVEDPTGEEGFNQGGWFLRVTDKDRVERAKVALAEAPHTEALLLGRRGFLS